MLIARSVVCCCANRLPGCILTSRGKKEQQLCSKRMRRFVFKSYVKKFWTRLRVFSSRNMTDTLMSAFDRLSIEDWRWQSLATHSRRPHRRRANWCQVALIDKLIERMIVRGESRQRPIDMFSFNKEWTHDTTGMLMSHRSSRIPFAMRGTEMRCIISTSSMHVQLLLLRFLAYLRLPDANEHSSDSIYFFHTTLIVAPTRETEIFAVDVHVGIWELFNISIQNNLTQNWTCS